MEELILSFILDHARPQVNGDDHRVRALLNFAGDEAKHIRRTISAPAWSTQAYRQLAPLSPAARDRIAAVASAFA